jgi:hypothetical protein
MFHCNVWGFGWLSFLMQVIKSDALDVRCGIDLFTTIVKEALFMWTWEFQLNSQPGILVFPKEENHWYTWCAVISLCFVNSHLPEFPWNQFASTAECLVVVVLCQYHPNTDWLRKIHSDMLFSILHSDWDFSHLTILSCESVLKDFFLRNLQEFWCSLCCSLCAFSITNLSH